MIYLLIINNIIHWCNKVLKFKNVNLFLSCILYSYIYRDMRLLVCYLIQIQ